MTENKNLSVLEYAGTLSFLLDPAQFYSPGEHRILQNSGISCLCPCFATELNGARQFIYLTDGLSTFADVCSQGKEIKTAALVTSAVRGISEVAKNEFLSVRNVDASLDHIFVDPVTLNVSFIYFPVNCGYYRDRFCFEQVLRTRLARCLMEKEFLTDPECMRLISSLQDLSIPMERLLPARAARAAALVHESAGGSVKSV